MSGGGAAAAMSAFDTLASTATNVWTNWYTNETNKNIANQNLKFQRENLDYQKALQQKIFQREDTAMSRKMADYRAAGLNPFAAVEGGGYNAGSVVPTQPLHNDFKADYRGIRLGSLVDAYKAYEQMKQASLETEYMQLINKRQSYDNVFAFIKNIDAGNKLYYDWAYNDKDNNTWRVPNVYYDGLSPEKTKQWFESSYQWQKRNLDLRGLSADVLTSETRQQFEFSRQLEDMITEGIGNLIGISNSARGWYGEYGKNKRYNPTRQNFSEEYKRNKFGYVRNRFYY